MSEQAFRERRRAARWAAEVAERAERQGMTPEDLLKHDAERAAQWFRAIRGEREARIQSKRAIRRAAASAPAALSTKAPDVSARGGLFTLAQASARTGVPARKLQRWCAEGWLPPTTRTAGQRKAEVPGRGSGHRRFEEIHVLTAIMIRVMYDEGIPYPKAVAAANKVAPVALLMAKEAAATDRR